MTLEPLPIPPSQLGESPFWHPDQSRLYWCDIEGFALHAWEPITGNYLSWSMPSEPGCCAPALNGKIVIGLRDGFYMLDPHTGILECLATLPHDTCVLRLNDGRCDTQGRFWAGSACSPKTHPVASLWCLSASSTGYKLRHMAGDNITANGLAFSPDNRCMYWANTPSHRIDRFVFDVETGTIADRQAWMQFAPQIAGETYFGRPDGASVDAQGNYWVAMYEGAYILQISAQARVLQRIVTPVQCPTMVCFGGDDLCTLYVTSANKGRPALESGSPIAAGTLFSARVDVRGLPVNFFRPVGF